MEPDFILSVMMTFTIGFLAGMYAMRRMIEKVIGAELDETLESLMETKRKLEVLQAAYERRKEEDDS